MHKVGDRVQLTEMADHLKEFNGRTGVITSWKPTPNHCGVKLDGDFREIAVFKWQVKEVDK